MATKVSKKPTKKKQKKEQVIVTKKKYIPPAGGIDLYKQSYIVVVDFGRPGIMRKVSMNQVDINFRNAIIKPSKKKKNIQDSVDKEMLKLDKLLLDSPELGAVITFDQQVRGYMYGISLPSPLKRGTYLIPKTLLPKVIDFLKEKQEQRELLVNNFMEVYPQRIKEAKKRLKEAFDQSQYLTSDCIRTKFRMGFKVRTMMVDQDIKNISEVIHEEETRKFSEELKDLHTDIANTLRLGFKQAVQRFVLALAPTPDGKRRKLHGSNVASLMEFLDTFNDKNIVQDSDCKLLVEQAKKFLQGRDAETITFTCRTDDNFRDKILQDFSSIAAGIESLEIDESRDVTF